ncbi:hypothetical protein ISF_04560 [Cordyceps fumosorosea ARSEF 2679]|uniref:Uncharacterized protein n=1 Tax=Cordyceps fumosorosea (strain ARSEF 2679) TaxID=1081104 RepID=A0A167WJ13_CORFA|nr:hypothetical protein ISF_04560 [Cordyceps fumosorosea ARSEF 2679]OAA63851.1 hypothetical protein ISF_04560 [Cordyceps fumosorosea ARSEF 2679]
MNVRTPSPPPSTREMQAPSAPRFGYQDDYHPYPKPSRSTRSSTQRNRTPSPATSHQKPPVSPRSTRRANIQSNAAMASPVPSPRKRRQPPADTSRRSVSGSLTAQSIANAAAALGPFDLPPTSNAVNSTGRGSSSRSSGMLPTPSKTPSKPANEKTAAEIATFARNLFSSDDSAPKRKPRSYSGLGMDSFTAKRGDEPIEIFTDTKDSIPEIDTSDANPFAGPSKQETATSPRRSRRKIAIPGEGSQSLEDAMHREDGMVYVFRGKRFWRRFDDAEEELDQDARLRQPLTRASVKPRLLFPPKKKELSEKELEDEEAMTDVEDEVKERLANPVPQTPTKTGKETAKTPEAPRYAPVSPPETRRTTRSSNRLLSEETPIKRRRQSSLFDSWPRTKKEPKAPAPTKRAGDDGLASTSTKRTRA